MIMFIIGVLIIIGSSVGIMHALFPAATSFTPGRRTRGIARWWERCTRWTHRLSINDHEPAQPLTREQVITARQMRQLGRAMTGVNYRPTTAEFDHAPPLDMDIVNRLLADINHRPMFSRGGILSRKTSPTSSACRHF